MRDFVASDPKFFNVVGNTIPLDFKGIKTEHFSAERMERHQRIIDTLGVPQSVVAFIINKHHRDGYEVHTIYDNGVIVVTNLITGRLITELVARPAQIKRYYQGNVPPMIEPIVAVAERNQRLGYNKW